MAKLKIAKFLNLWSGILATIAIGLALAGGVLPIVIFGWAIPLIIMQIAGWWIVIGGIIAILKAVGLMK